MCLTKPFCPFSYFITTSPLRGTTSCTHFTDEKGEALCWSVHPTHPPGCNSALGCLPQGVCLMVTTGLDLNRTSLATLPAHSHPPLSQGCPGPSKGLG